MSAYCTPIAAPGEVMTDMQYSLYPSSLYENIVRGAALRVPMYISEIGAADRSESDHVRIAHIESFSRQVCSCLLRGVAAPWLWVGPFGYRSSCASCGGCGHSCGAGGGGIV